MKMFKILWMSVLLFMVTGCNQGDGYSLDIKEVERPQSVVQAATPTFLSFTWIEKGFEGVFAAVDHPLGETKSTLLDELGEPNEVGTYEGGTYFSYGRSVYIFNAESYQTSAISMDISDYKVTSYEMKRALGTPDEENMDEHSGYYNYVYHLGAYTLRFEELSEDQGLKFAWFTNREKQEGVN